MGSVYIPSRPGSADDLAGIDGTLKDIFRTYTVCPGDSTPGGGYPYPGGGWVAAAAAAWAQPEALPPCDGGGPQWVDANLTAAAATARTLAANVADGSVPPSTARGMNPLTSSRIAQFERMAANMEHNYGAVAKTVARSAAVVNVFNIASGFRNSVSDGLHAVVDVAAGTGLAFVPLVGVPLSVAYSAHGGSKALINDVKYLTGQCRAQ